MTIVEFLNARLDEDEKAARDAIDPDRPGEHWQWVDPSDDTPAEPQEGGYLRGASLRTVEKFPTRLGEEHPEWFSDGKGHLPAFAIDTVDEMREGVGVHIARHDPARVLAEVQATRAVVDLHVCSCSADCGDCGACSGDHHADPTPAPCDTLRHLATPYADHPDYRQEWAL